MVSPIPQPGGLDGKSSARTVRSAATLLAVTGLTDAFGHISVRVAPERLLMTPPIPMGAVVESTELVDVDLAQETLPAAAPKEAWLHVGVLNHRPDVGAVCRAQPPAVAALVAAGGEFTPATGHLAMLGPVALYPDSRLVRDPASAAHVVATLGTARAVVLRGNGAVSVGPDLPSALATMWLLEQSARLLLAALAAGTVRALPDDEQADWQARAPELLPRIYTYLLSLGNALGKERT